MSTCGILGMACHRRRSCEFYAGYTLVYTYARASGRLVVPQSANGHGGHSGITGKTPCRRPPRCSPQEFAYSTLDSIRVLGLLCRYRVLMLRVQIAISTKISRDALPTISLFLKSRQDNTNLEKKNTLWHRKTGETTPIQHLNYSFLKVRIEQVQSSLHIPLHLV